MDTSTIVLGILAMALFIVPIYYIQHKQKANIKKAKKPFLDAAQRNGLQLSQHDFWNERYGIGIDETKGSLFYWNNQGSNPQETVIELGAVKQSVVDSAYREVNGNRIIDAIGIRIASHGAKDPNAYLQFYVTEGIMLLKGELQLAEKWNAIIQSKTKSRKAVQV